MNNALVGGGGGQTEADCVMCLFIESRSEVASHSAWFTLIHQPLTEK